jgi:hypothetical protein
MCSFKLWNFLFYCTFCYTLWDWLFVLQVLLYIVGLVECTARVVIYSGIGFLYYTCSYTLWDCLVVLHVLLPILFCLFVWHVLLYIVGLVECSTSAVIHCGIGCCTARVAILFGIY